LTTLETTSSPLAAAYAAPQTLLRRSAADAPTHRIADSHISVLAASAQTGGLFSVAEIFCAPQGGPPPQGALPQQPGTPAPSVPVTGPQPPSPPRPVVTEENRGNVKAPDATSEVDGNR